MCACVRLCVYHGVCVSQCVCLHVMFMWNIRIGTHTHMPVRMQWSARQVHWRTFWIVFAYSILWQIQIILNTFTMQINLLRSSPQHHTLPRFSSSFLFKPHHPPQVSLTLQSQHTATPAAHCGTPHYTNRLSQSFNAEQEHLQNPHFTHVRKTQVILLWLSDIRF